jgi:hypothetical protein
VSVCLKLGQVFSLSSLSCRQRRKFDSVHGDERKRKSSTPVCLNLDSLFSNPPAISIGMCAKLLYFCMYTVEIVLLFWLPLPTRYQTGDSTKLKNTCNCATGYANKLMTWDWTFGHLQWKKIHQTQKGESAHKWIWTISQSRESTTQLSWSCAVDDPFNYNLRVFLLLWKTAALQ